jgi:hypothetical protein
MTNEQRQKILDIFAFRVGQIYFELGRISTTREFCYQKAEEFLKLDQEINGEDHLLCLLREDKNEN